MSKEIDVSDLKSVCPFCGGIWEFNAYFSPDGLVVSCKDCGAIVDAHIADVRPLEDILRAERDEAREMVEKLIEAISGYFFGEEPRATWRKKLSDLFAEWKEEKR